MRSGRSRRSLVVRTRGPVICAMLASSFVVALARAGSPDILVTNGSFEADGRLEVAYSLTYSTDDEATCSASPASPVTVAVGATGTLRAEPSTLVFDSCDDHQNVIFTARSPGSHDVYADITAGPTEGLKVSPGLIYMRVFDAPERRVMPGNTTDDSIPPRWACDPPAATSEWHADNVTLACKAWDDESGLSLGTPAYFTLATSAAETEETSDADTGIEILCDVAGNCTLAGNMRGFNVDIRGPDQIRIIGPISEGDSFVWGHIPPNEHACTAADFGSGLDSCTVEGHSTEVGAHVLVAEARDRMGNTAQANLFYRVEPWAVTFHDGFGAGSDPRTVAGGSRIEIPFEVFAGGEGVDEQSDPSIVTSMTRQEVSCELGIAVSGLVPFPHAALVRTIDEDQFVLAWDAPDRPSCHTVRLDLVDGERRTVSVRVD